MTHTKFPIFYVLLHWPHSLSISNRNLLQLLEEVGYINVLIINDNVYLDLMRVFYSNMDTYAKKENRVITNIGGVLIEFDDTKLNSLLGTTKLA